MPIDPKNYAWLDAVPQPLPRMVQEARRLLGTKELTGAANNKVILGWADELGGKVDTAYTVDAIPWCGLFLAVVAKRAGKTPVHDPLWALNWGKFGEPAGQPALGDVLTFIRKGGGHVAIYIAEDAEAYHVLGGNQSDCVCFARYDKDRLKSARRPPYMNKPASVRPYKVKAAGGLAPRDE
jgi:uncharacterized protein (TIGR02594 family)